MGFPSYFVYFPPTLMQESPIYNKMQMKYNFLESHSFYTYIQYAWALYRIYMSDELILYGWD